MAQFPEKKPIQDITRIKLNETWQINYWCKTFNCSAEELRNAVANAGTNAEDVRREVFKIQSSTFKAQDSKFTRLR